MSESSRQRQQEREPLRLCKDCKYLIDPPEAEKPGCVPDVPRCRLAKMIDLVMGEDFHAPCQDFRHPNAPCGTKGKMFMPKNIQVIIGEEPGKN